MATSVGNRAPVNEPITSHFTVTALPVYFIYFKLLYISDKKWSVSGRFSSLNLLFTSLRNFSTVLKHCTSNLTPTSEVGSEGHLEQLSPLQHDGRITQRATAFQITHEDTRALTVQRQMDNASPSFRNWYKR